MSTALQRTAGRLRCDAERYARISALGKPSGAAYSCRLEKRAADCEAAATVLEHAEQLKLAVHCYQQDWMPGFAAFLDDGSIQEGAAPKIAINLGAFMAAVANDDIAKEDLPYVIAESIMHELIHVLEAWAGVEFNEDRVEGLLSQYAAAQRGESKESTS